MDKIDLSTQQKRWAYLASGGKLRRKDGYSTVEFKDGKLLFYQEYKYGAGLIKVSEACLRFDEWEELKEPMRDEFQAKVERSNAVFIEGVIGFIANSKLGKYVDRKVKVTIEEIME
jgi:hypothetical protein